MQDFITKSTLVALGIDLDDQDVESLLERLNDAVEERIGDEIIESLDDDELEELVKLQKTATPKELGDWIAEYVSDYDQIVSDEIDIVIGELAENADRIK